MAHLKIHIISTGKQSFEQIGEIMQEIHPYVDMLHIREKYRTAKELQNGIELLFEYGIPTSKIFVNDRVDVAWGMNLAGVQLAHHSLDVNRVKNRFPGLQIGVSVHSVIEAKQMEEAGADFVVFGHIFQTLSKPGLPAKGIYSLQQVVHHVTIPVIAIGGIKHSNIKQIMETGVSGVAVMSGILEASDPRKEIELYRMAIQLGDVEFGKL